VTRRCRLIRLATLLVLTGPTMALAAPPTSNPPVTASVVTAAAGSPAVSQLDPSLAIDPADGLHRVVAAREGATGRVGLWSTADGGGAWSFHGDLPLPAGTVEATRAQLAWGSASGSVYTAWQGRTTSGSGADCAPESGTWLASSGDGGETWSQEPDAIEGGDDGTAGFVSRGWTSLTTDRSTRSTAGQPIMAVERATWTGACGALPVTRELTLAWRVVGSSGTVHDADFAIPGVSDASNPSIVSIPGPLPTVEVAYISTAAPHPTIMVVRCSRDDASPTNPFGLDWACTTPVTVSDAAFTLVTSIAAGAQAPAATIAVTSAPSIAVDGNNAGALYVAYTTATADGTRVAVTASDPTGTTWTAPITVGEPPGVVADQALPAIAVAQNGRADVLYLDRRDGGATVGPYAAYQTSFLCSTLDDCATGPILRGDDVALGAVAPAPALVGGSWTLGTQLAVADVQNVPTPLSGHTIALWPQAGDVASSELWHGSRTPQITPGLATDVPRHVAKNVATPLAEWFLPSDPDGDPVSVSLAVAGGPTHGAVIAGSYVPDTSFTGDDAFTIIATDGRLSTTAAHPVTVVDQAPRFTTTSTPWAVAEGGRFTMPLAAVDPDPGDGLTYSIGYIPAELRVNAQSVVLGHDANGPTLEVWAPPGVRSRSPLRIDVVVTDTSLPPLSALTARLQVLVNITPNVTVPTVTLTLGAVSGRTVRLEAAPLWSDPDAGCLSATTNHCHWELTWRWDAGDATTTTGTTATVTHTYAAAGYYTPTVTARIVGYSYTVPASSVAGLTTGTPRPDQVAVSDDARTHLFVQPTGTRAGLLRVSVRSHDTATLDVTIVVAATRRSYHQTLRVTRGTAGALGSAAVATFRLGRLPATGVTVVVGYAEGLASEPAPRPVHKVFWIR
jgi:hypothetical protein